jgi:DNA repair protein RecO (recombination protein O)
MLHKTRGIVLNYIRFRETSIIVKIYTEEFGLQTYIENGVRSSRSRNKIALFQPLTLLDLVVYHRDNGSIMRISEIKCNTPFQTLPYQFVKTGIALFITEVLTKSLKEESGNPDMFWFLFQSILFLDTQPEAYENFPIQFLLKLSRYLGFAPQQAKELMEQIGEVRLTESTEAESEALNGLIRRDYDQYLRLPGAIRRSLLEHVLRFYQLHVENFNELRSLPVLKEMMG